MKFPRECLVPLSLATLLALSSCTAIEQRSAIDRLKPCKSADGPSDGYCGTFEVFEDRQAKSGRKIPLKIVILPALKQKSAPDPVFFLAGGPGQGAAALASQLKEPFRLLQTDRDIVMVDQRGTGKSNPLECKPGKKEDDEDPGDGSAFVKRLRGCLDSYKDKADVTRYTTSIAMDDLDDVRRYLGYGKINIYGGSYGTRAAMEYVRRYRANTRSAVIDGVAPPDMRLPLYMARDGQRAIDILFSDCAKEPSCGERFPRLKERFLDLIAKLKVKPQHIRYVHPRTGEEKDLDVKRLTVAGILFTTLYAPTSASLVPLLIEQAEKGNFSGFLALGSAFDPSSGSLAQGMHFSVVCSEDAPRIQPGQVDQETADTFLGAEIAELRLKPCDFWPKGQVEPSYFTDIASDVPALILSGQLDPVTPPSWGEQVAAQWKNSKHIVVPATGHGAWSSGCVLKLMSKFYNDGTAAKLDPACVQNVKRPPFFLGPSGPDPMNGTKSAAGDKGGEK
ncbi:MAG: alpha/beta hydrolase [Acidobacteria bacterium]|nr:alpha/beta hydrolase [Acidobacteriota bacterium]